MSGLLPTSLSGLKAAQRSLEAVQHNISNVNTEGYSRQRVELVARPAQFTGDGYVGQGVTIANISRSYDQFINKQLSSSLSAFGEVDRYHQLAARIDNIMADPNTGIAPVMKRFFNAVNEVADNPSSIPSRQVMLSETEILTQSFNTMNGRFEDIRALNNNDISVMVDEINSLAKGIADINVQILSDLGKTQGFRQPNDLLDKQDALLGRLSEIVNVSVVHQVNGMSSVFIGNGQSLVLNGGAAEFNIIQSEFDPGRLEIGLKTASGVNMEMTNQISGGALGGSLRFRDEVLDPAQQKLGRVAVGLAMDFNALHKSGFDLTGTAGLDLFSFSGVEVPVIESTLNSGNAAVTVSFQDTNPLASASLDFSDFNLEYVNAGGGVDYTLTRIRDNRAINLTATDTVPPTGVFTLSFATTQPANFDATAFTLSTSISPGTFTQAISSGTAAVAQEETIGAFTPAFSNGADSFVMNIDGIPFYSEAGSVGGTVSKAELDTALIAFLSQPANAAAYTLVSGSFSGDDLVLRKFSGTPIALNITSNFATTPGAFAANTVNVAGSVAVAPTGGPFTLEVDGLQIYTEAASTGGTVTHNELDAALNTFLTTGRGAGVYVKTGSFATNDLVLSKAGQTSTLTISSNFSGVGSTAGAFSGSTAGVTAVPAGIDIQVDLSGGKTISVGDQFVTRPTYSAAYKIGVNIDDPKKIAAATNVEVDPVTKLPVFPASIIKGPMPSDNRNAILLAGLENRLGMLGGNASFSDAYGQIVSGVGTLTRTAEISSSAQETLLNQARESRESLVGVNLDEEAANLIKFQQAYQASAQSISVVKSLFDTLMGAVR